MDKFLQTKDPSTFVHCFFENLTLLMYLDSVACRIKQTPIHPSSVIQLYTTTYGSAFEGDVLVIYGPSQNKNHNSPVKTNILHADLVDKDRQMTIIASVSDNLIKRFGSFLQPGKSV